MGRVVFELLVIVLATLVMCGICILLYVFVSKLPMMLAWLSGIIGEVGSWVILILTIVGIVSFCIEMGNEK